MARPQAGDYGEKQQLIRDRAAELFSDRGPTPAGTGPLVGAVASPLDEP